MLRRPALFLITLLLSAVLLGCGCATTPTPPGSGPPSGPDPDQVAAMVYQSALLGVATGKAAALGHSDGPACLALSIADGALRTGYQVWTDTRAEIAGPDGEFSSPPMVVDARACVPLGIPAPAAADAREAELRAAAAMGAAGARSVAVMLCASFGTDAPECYGASWSAAVVDAGLDAWTAVVVELQDETAHPDGVVIVELPPLIYPMLVQTTDDAAPTVAAAEDAAVNRWVAAAADVRRSTLTRSDGAPPPPPQRDHYPDDAR